MRRSDDPTGLASEHRDDLGAADMSTRPVLWKAFAPIELGEAERDLQRQVREFLARELPRGTFEPGLGMNNPADPEFSRKLAARGWVGMALPKRYGGGERTAVERFIVTEELLRWGAPVNHHWVADRQSGPVINRFGTEQQKERFLPAICRGELGFSIGMSEPDSGSDLASVKTRARRTDGGWLVTGTKVWTTGAHRNDWCIVLCRTSDEADKRDGLSQFLVDLRAPGVQVNPIPFLDGSADFSEVVLSEVFVADDLVLGKVGQGWAQCTSELAYERGGPDRWLSTYLVVEQLLREREQGSLPDDPELLTLLGEAVARWWNLRGMSLCVARGLDAGEEQAVPAALVKEMGTRFEQDVLTAVERLVALSPSPDSSSLFERLLAASILAAPSFTLRGGTSEIMRSVVMKGLTS